MLRITQLKLKPGHTPEELHKKAARLLRLPPTEIKQCEIVKRSVDARKKPEIYYTYTVDIELGVSTGEQEQLVKRLKDAKITLAAPVSYTFPVSAAESKGEQPERPVIVGMGPAGLFCGYMLAMHGFRPILLERGECVEDRQQTVERFWREGLLNPESNVQFGEGGAGTFSDGKLNTLVKDKDGRNREVLKTFVRFGAPEEILYENKPHIGTDILCEIVKNMRTAILEAGGEIRFQSKVTKLQLQDGAITGVTVNDRETIEAKRLVLAIGHSARDTFEMLYEEGIPMEAKSFAVGFRVEHPQSKINLAQYGEENPASLPAADYKVTAQTSLKRAVYSFCMCPGGYIVNASSEEGRLAVNGMSYSTRNEKAANSAIITAVTPADYPSSHPLAGIAFQRQLEEAAYAAGKGLIPVELFGDFKAHKLESFTEKITPHTKGGYRYSDVRNILPEQLNQAIIEGIEQFGRVISGFNSDDALLAGIESRTSSPVRISRNEGLQSSIKGLYPCGEGAGYAGGITSAAMDGIRIAEQLALEIQSKQNGGVSI